MELLPPGWEDLGAKGLVVLFVLMIFLGWILPKRWVDRQLADKDDTIAFQRETIRQQDEILAKLTTAAQNLAVPAHTAATALRSIAREAETKAGDEK